MVEMDIANNEVKNLHGSVMQRIEGITDPSIKITITKDFEGLNSQIPSQEELMQKLDEMGSDAKYLKGVVPLIYDFLETPIINYPTDNPIDSVIDPIDKKISAMFSTQEEKDEVNKIINNNRMRPNKLMEVSSTLQLTQEVVGDVSQNMSEKIKRIYNNLTPLTDPNNKVNKSTYKLQSPEEKRRIVKEYTHAAQMSLRILNGENPSEEDWKELETK